MKYTEIRTIALLLMVSFSCLAQREGRTEKVILITLDGFRWQELYGGADQRLLTDPQFVEDTLALKNIFGAATSQERREKLLPFFWNVIAKQGQLYGNRTLGNNVNVTNNMWFSYPGYNEILTGSADDVNITSNDPINNPNETVLEFLNKQKKLHGKIAAFTSWETFPWIINTTRSGVPVNAGYMKAGNPNVVEEFMNEILFQLPNESGGTRPDAFTFHYAFEHLKKKKPDVLFMSFDETDHFAHEGKYDKYLASAHYTDGLIKSLWEWVQRQPDYKDKTTLIITTDHGRGDNAMDGWRHHGRKTENCDQIWVAFIGPDSSPIGEVKTSQQLYQNQIATSVAALFGFEFKGGKKKGDVISTAVKKFE